ncbi:MAG: pre-peptidase C-terminal domain-containing protein [Pseudomonadota bacterium]
MSFQSRVLCALALTLAALAPSVAMADAKYIYVTRHAEKGTAVDDPALTAAGVTRAQNIAATLKKANITSIYSTNFLRTQQTAQPLATLLTLPVKSYDGGQIPTFAQQLLALPGNTLVVGHTDTVPDLIRQLGGDTIAPIAETEFDRLYQIGIGADGDVTTTLLNSLPSVTTPPPCASVSLNKTGLSAAKDTWVYFTITVPECANTLTVTTTGSVGDADLHVKFGSQATGADAACRPYKTGSNETCVLPDPQAGVWYIGIKAFAPFSGLTLNAVAAQ